MNVLIAGATGETGTRPVHELLSREHDPMALVRDDSDTDSLPDAVHLRHRDLTELPDDVCKPSGRAHAILRSVDLTEVDGAGDAQWDGRSRLMRSA